MKVIKTTDRFVGIMNVDTGFQIVFSACLKGTLDIATTFQSSLNLGQSQVLRIQIFVALSHLNITKLNQTKQREGTLRIGTLR